MTPRFFELSDLAISPNPSDMTSNRSGPFSMANSSVSASLAIADSFSEQAVPTDDVNAAQEPARVAELSKLMIAAFESSAERLGFKMAGNDFPTKSLGFAVWHVSESW